jgi:tRNA-splicing ligase RtcB
MIFGTHDDNTLEQFADVSSRAVKAALMADGHLGYVMPIGGVAGYENLVSVVGVGFDIACGNAAIRTNLRAEDFDRREWGQIADTIFDEISFGLKQGQLNRAHDAPVDHPVLSDERWKWLPTDRAESASLLDKARNQLGTIGSGNHYVDVFEDEAGTIWVGVHFGSRGLGHTIASGFLALSQGEPWGTRVPEQETLLNLDPYASLLGPLYWDLMELAGDYAYAGREWVARKVVDILGADELELIHNHHNFAWKEKHGGQDLVVVRKGATPAFPWQKGFVGGSMGDDSVILQGNPACSPVQQAALYSTVHGAGRVMSRTAARGKWKKGVMKKAGAVSPEGMNNWIEERGVILRGGDLDEAPQAYRRLPDVLAAQGDTIEVLHTLTPRVVCMAPRVR